MAMVALFLSMCLPAAAAPDSPEEPVPVAEAPAPAAATGGASLGAPVPEGPKAAAPTEGAAPAGDPAEGPVPPLAALATMRPVPAKIFTKNTVEIPQTAGDVVGMGNTVRIQGAVGDNAVLLGRTISIRAPVGGDVLAMGQLIKVDAPIGGDLYAMGAEVQITDSGSVGGTILATAQRIVVEGPVRGDVSLRSEQLELDGQIFGDASLVFGQLELGRNARVDGDLQYIAPKPAPALVEVTQGASSYSLTDEVDVSDIPRPMEVARGLLSRGLGVIGSYLAQLLVGAGMLLVLGEFARRPARTIAQQPLISLVLGSAAMVAIPVLTIVVGFIFARLGFVDLLAGMITAATPPLAAAAATVWGFGFIVGRILTALMIGELVLARFAPHRKDNPTAALAAGLVPLVLLSAIPWLDVAVWGIATALGLGGVWLYLRVASKAPEKG